MNHFIVKCQACGAGNRIPAAKQHLGPRCGRCRQPLDIRGTAVPVELNDTDFQSFIANSPLPVMVAFLSPSCGYCRMMIPVIDSVARRYANRFIVAKIDTSQSPGTSSRFRLRGVPALLFFKGGKKVDQLEGAVDEGTLVRKMAVVLAV
jgi:thioredoxin 2